MNREKMILMLLLGLTSCVCGMYLVKMSPPLYDAEENGDITIGWDFQTTADMTRSNMVCFLQSEPLKLFYQMIKGVEAPESQHQQFAGRVQCDGDALRDARVRLHVSAVTAEDSGNYRCDLAAAYDKTTGRWELEASEKFVLNVSRRSEGGAADEPFTGQKQPKGSPHEEYLFLALFIAAQLVTVAAALGKIFCKRPEQEDSDRSGRSGAESWTDEVHVHVPENSGPG
ncbi:uncharacterized protein LOC130164530 [Seriola aureovittata]|uniref:uncharacterized protein LOC130164530 n=1 Tax=Seriola aureovittata TaxID=2871759 RepID=UPI0024BEC8E3|nr:uncharacterized protein LOC130164530 [Seriola aureovittata]